MAGPTASVKAPGSLSATIPRRQALLLTLLALLLARGSTGKLISPDSAFIRLSGWREARRRATEEKRRRETETPL